MARCTVCNWTPHDESDHKGPKCRNGHPLDIVGVYVYGNNRKCKECQAEQGRRYLRTAAGRENQRARNQKKAEIKRAERMRASAPGGGAGVPVVGAGEAARQVASPADSDGS